MRPRAISHDRWLLSYADFVTLLFACFVILYASVQAHKSSAVSSGAASPAGAHSAASAAQIPPADSELLRELRQGLAADEANGFLTIVRESRRTVITINDRACFSPGAAEVNSEAAARFGRIGAILSRFPNQLVLEGHTDSVPIHNERFSSNWALSTARSMAVMELLERGSAIVPERFSIAGSANNAPVSTNDTEAGRSRNRRVDIAVLDEPGPVSFDPGSVQRGSPGRN